MLVDALPHQYYSYIVQWQDSGQGCTFNGHRDNEDFYLTLGLYRTENINYNLAYLLTQVPVDGILFVISFTYSSMFEGIHVMYSVYARWCVVLLFALWVCQVFEVTEGTFLCQLAYSEAYYQGTAKYIRPNLGNLLHIKTWVWWQMNNVSRVGKRRSLCHIKGKVSVIINWHISVWRHVIMVTVLAVMSRSRPSHNVNLPQVSAVWKWC